MERTGQPVAYVDADIMFHSSPEPVFTEIGGAPAAVFPHNFARASQGLPGPTVESHEVFGQYNVGLVYVADRQVAEEWAEKIDLVFTAHDRLLSGRLIMTVRGAPSEPADLPRRPLTIRAGSVGGRMTTATDAAGAAVASVEFDVAALAEKKGRLYVWSVDETSGARETPVRASTLAGRRRAWSATPDGVYRATLTKSDRGQLILEAERMGPRKVISRVRGRLRRMAEGTRWLSAESR